MEMADKERFFKYQNFSFSFYLQLIFAIFTLFHAVFPCFSSVTSHTPAGPSEGTTLGSTGPGAETMEEMADKERFFKELEEKRGGRVDYSQLNKDADMTGTLGGTMGSLPSPYMG